MKKLSKKKNIQVLLLCSIAALLIFSCTGESKRKTESVESKLSYLPPVTFLLDTMPPPKKVELKNAPLPRVTVVPKTGGGSNSTKASMPVAHFTNFNTEDGLALANVQGEFLDSKGRLWFGSGGAGVSCYDGTGFTNFNTSHGISSPSVICIAEDKKGGLWFGTNPEGVSYYNGNKFTKYTTADGLADNTIFSIAIDSNENMWFCTINGASKFDGKKFTTFNSKNGLPHDNVNKVVFDRNGNTWFITFGGGICKYDGKSFKTYTVADGLPTNNMLCLLEDSSGIIWLGSYEKGISRFDGKNFTTINVSNNPTANSVTEITKDRDGTIWFATTGGGIGRYDGKGFMWLTTDQGLAHNSISSIIKDRLDNIWFGTMGGGLSRYNGKGLISHTSKTGLPENYIRCITEDRYGNLWLGTNGDGLISFDGSVFTTYSTRQGLADNFVGAVIEDKNGRMWIGTVGGGINCLDGTKFTTYTTEHGIGGNNIANLFQDSKGNIWVGTFEGGVSKFDGKEFTTYTTTQGLAHNTIKAFAEDDLGNIWFGSGGGGVSRFDGRSFTNFTTDQGLSNNNVSDIKKDKSGKLWIASYGGLSRYDGSELISFHTTEGLPDEVVCNIAEDKNGAIWLGTNQGIANLKFKDLSNGQAQNIEAGSLNISNAKLKLYEPVWETYNNKTGYPIKDMIDGSMIIKKKNFPQSTETDAGKIWAPCGDVKLIRFDHNAVIKNLAASDPFIRSVRIEDHKINWYGLKKTRTDSVLITQQEAIVYGSPLLSKIRDSINRKFSDVAFDSITPFYQVPLNLVLPYLHNRVDFVFGAIETSRNFMVRYQYMLEGYDKEWGPITENTLASYGNISEGDYIFKLRARSPEGVWSEPIAYSFKVQPPWWRTWWFRIIMGIGLLLFLYGIYRWRTASLHKQKRVLERTVKERTAEVVRQKEKSDELLLNILPSEVADELKEKGHTTARSFDEVTVLFSDIKGFTSVAEKLTAQELVKEIDTYFSAFDNLMQKHGLEKIKTIGDAYIAAGGLPEKNSASAQNVVEAAIDMQHTIQKLKQERILLNKPYFELRIGIHTGPVVAGVVGIKKFQYDIWGDTVNIAARMEQSGFPGKINISQHTYEVVRDKFNCVHRGKIEAKNKGEIDMYFVE